jgi:hypothetical protein
MPPNATRNRTPKNCIFTSVSQPGDIELRKNSILLPSFVQIPALRQSAKTHSAKTSDSRLKTPNSRLVFDAFPLAVTFLGLVSLY